MSNMYIGTVILCEELGNLKKDFGGCWKTELVVFVLW